MSSKQAIMLAKMGRKKEFEGAKSPVSGDYLPDEDERTPLPKTKKLMESADVPSSDSSRSFEAINATRRVNPSNLNSVKPIRTNYSGGHAEETGDFDVPSIDKSYSPIKNYLKKRK